MVEMVIVVILAVGLVLVSMVAVGAMLWMRRQEQKQDFAMKNADTLLRLDDALHRALKEIDMKKQSLLSQYKPTSPSAVAEEASLHPLTETEVLPPIKRGRGRPRKTPIVVNAPVVSADAPQPQPIPRKQSGNAKRQKVLDLRAQGMIIPDIAKKLSMNQGAVTLILDTADKPSE